MLVLCTECVGNAPPPYTTVPLTRAGAISTALDQGVVEHVTPVQSPVTVPAHAPLEEHTSLLVQAMPSLQTVPGASVVRVKSRVP